MAKYASEFLGTAILFCAVVGSGIMGENLSSENDQVTLLTNTLATVFALYFLINSLQPFSTHFNPAVSFVFCLKGEISVKTCTGRRHSPAAPRTRESGAALTQRSKRCCTSSRTAGGWRTQSLCL